VALAPLAGQLPALTRACFQASLMTATIIPITTKMTIASCVQIQIGDIVA
jgi:hypothetical protein